MQADYGTDDVSHTSTFESSEKWNHQLVSLPSVARCRILSHLDWKDRITAGSSIPGWYDDLHTSYSWMWVEFTNWVIGLPDGYNSPFISDGVKQEECMRTYGRYFKHCTVALSVFDVREGSHGVKLLNEISNCCPSLRSLKIYHEFMFCSFEGKWEDYLIPLKNLCQKCKTLKYVQLCNLDSCLKNHETGNCKFFEVMEELQMCEMVELLEFNLHKLCNRPVTELGLFSNLHTLRTEHSSISTSIVQCLVQQSLQHLHIVRDQNTAKLTGDRSRTPILWHEISPRTNLSVHYVFDEVKVEQNDFAVNPYLVSITLKKLPNALSRDVLRNIAALYAKSLSTFAHLSMLHPTLMPYEDMESLPCDYYYFASECTHLKTFMCGIPVLCEAVWCLAMKAKKLQNLYVQKGQLLYNYRVCLPVPSTLQEGGSLENEVCFSKEVSHWLDYNWSPMTEDELDERSSRLLQF